MTATVADIIKAMEEIAPSDMAEEWDNTGLQIGRMDQPVEKILIALDPAFDVVNYAARNNVDLLITHHPLIFKPLQSIDFSTPTGSVIQAAVKNEIAVYAAHTNFDSVVDGINDALALRIGLKNLRVLSKSKDIEKCKLVFYVPVEYEQKLLKALFETNAGQIGTYTCCSFRNNGKGTFRPGHSSRPFFGKPDEIAHVDEIRLETIVKKNDIKDTIEHLRRQHPYETMAYDVYPLSLVQSGNGLGRLGEIEQSLELEPFAMLIKKRLGLDFVRIAGEPDLPVRTIAVCTGSGSGLINDFFRSGAQVYVTGDLGYHIAREVEEANLGLVDIGHFASEHLMVAHLVNRLDKILTDFKFDVIIEGYKLEKDPFVML